LIIIIIIIIIIMDMFNPLHGPLFRKRPEKMCEFYIEEEQ